MGQEKTVVQNTVKTVRETTELFYQQKTQEGYVKMQDTLNSILNAVDTLHAYKVSHEEFPLEEQRLVNALTDAMNAMEEADTVLLADILEYDFAEYLQELAEQME